MKVAVQGGVQLHVLVEQVEGEEDGRDIGEQGTARVHLNTAEITQQWTAST